MSSALDELIERYKTQPEVLDALYQWAHMWLSSEIYQFIEYNLTIRYGEDKARNIIKVLQDIVEKELERLKTEGVYKYEYEIVEAIKRSKILEEHVVKILDKLNDYEKQVVSLLSMESVQDEIEYDYNESRLKAFIASSIEIAFSVAINAMIKGGVINKYILSTSRRDREFFVPYYVKNISQKLLELSKSNTSYLLNIISGLVSKEGYNELAVLDELAWKGKPMYMKDYHKGFPSWKGIIGKYRDYITLSPFLVETVKKELKKIKIELTKDYSTILERTLELLRERYWPKMEFTKIEDDMSIYWEVELSIGRPIITIALSPWMTPNIAKYSYHSLFFITHQSFEMAKTIFREYSSSIGNSVVFVLLKDKEINVQKPSNADLDPFIDEFIETFKDMMNKQEVSSIQESITKEDIPQEVTKEEVEIAAKEANIATPTPSDLSTISTDEIIIGNNKHPKQWGILGKTPEGKIVKIDLNSPHIIFICGKMGSGKGYTIGVICEMLCSRSISKICHIEKPATIIVLYTPREDKISEFWSIRYKNDVKIESDKLKKEYGLEPLEVIDESKFKVFIDPYIFDNAADMFMKEYKTKNVFPIYVDPSSLTGKEWSIVLATGDKSDQLYIKRLFSIIEKRQFQKFDLNTIRSDILNDNNLTSAQKNLALQRLDILENYLNSGNNDFIQNLAIGGVNIFDFRKTIRTPDDIFSVMTLILSRLQTKQGLEDEPFVFIINEAHDYFKKHVAEDFVESIEYLIRRKRHGGNWLILDTHLPDDVDDKVIKLADIKMVNFLDKTVDSKILNAAFKDMTNHFSKLHIGQTLIAADESSLGKFTPIQVDVRPRLTKHGAPTKEAVSV